MFTKIIEFITKPIYWVFGPGTNPDPAVPGPEVMQDLNVPQEPINTATEPRPAEKMDNSFFGKLKAYFTSTYDFFCGQSKSAITRVEKVVDVKINEEQKFNQNEILFVNNEQGLKLIENTEQKIISNEINIEQDKVLGLIKYNLYAIQSGIYDVKCSVQGIFKNFDFQFKCGNMTRDKIMAEKLPMSLDVHHHLSKIKHFADNIDVLSDETVKHLDIETLTDNLPLIKEHIKNLSQEISLIKDQKTAFDPIASVEECNPDSKYFDFIQETNIRFHNSIEVMDMFGQRIENESIKISAQKLIKN